MTNSVFYTTTKQQLAGRMDDDLDFDFERNLQQPVASTFGHGPGHGTQIVPHIPANANIGQSLGNFKKNYRQVCCQFLVLVPS